VGNLLANKVLGRKNMEWLIMVGVVAFYFALQLWILPKMGIKT